VGHTERLGDLVNRQYGGIAFPTLQVAKILLGQPASLSQFFLGEAVLFANTGAIVANEFSHVHAGNHWRSAAHWFIYYSMYPPDLAGTEPVAVSAGGTSPAAASRSGQVFATERSAKYLLCAGDCRYRIPTAAQKRALLIGFAMCGKALAGTAYDAVRLEGEVDLDDCHDVAAKNDRIVLIEVKSTGQEKIDTDLAGYFFNITSAEMVIAQTLKDQYRFAFLNTVRGDWQELTLSEKMGRAKAIYPAFHIRL
jgi:hypothetical protein